MQGRYTRESAKEISDKLHSACLKAAVLDQLKEYIDYELREVEPSLWTNLSALRNKIKEWEQDTEVV